MKCLRCQRQMVEAQFFDLNSTDGFMWMKGWRCCICGVGANPLIEANRLLRTEIQPALPAMDQNARRMT